MPSQVRRMLSVFGELKSVELPLNPSAPSPTSKGFACCEFVEPAVTEHALSALRGVTIDGACMATSQAAGAQGGKTPPALFEAGGCVV